MITRLLTLTAAALALALHRSRSRVRDLETQLAVLAERLTESERERSYAEADYRAAASDVRRLLSSLLEAQEKGLASAAVETRLRHALRAATNSETAWHALAREVLSTPPSTHAQKLCEALRELTEQRDALADDALKLETYLRGHHPAEEWEDGFSVDAAIRVMERGEVARLQLAAIHHAAGPTLEYVKRWAEAPVTSAPGVAVLVSAVLSTMPGHHPGARTAEALEQAAMDASDERLDAAGGGL